MKISPTKALGKMNEWYEKVTALDNNNFSQDIPFADAVSTGP